MKKSLFTKLIIAIFTAVVCIPVVSAQEFDDVDKIPQDIAYFRETRVTKPLVKIIYGRPSLTSGETISDKIVYGKLWRTGANEATEIKLYQEVLFGGSPVKAGTYVLYTIPRKDTWEIILSKNLDVWGAFQYNSNADVVKITIPVKKAERLEAFSIGFKRNEDNVLMVLAWDTLRVAIPLKFTSQTHYAKR